MSKSLAGVFGFVLVVIGLALPLVGMKFFPFDMTAFLLALVSFAAAWRFLAYALARTYCECEQHRNAEKSASKSELGRSTAA